MQVNLSTASLAAVPGSLATLILRVRNQSKIVDQFAIEVVGEPSAWSVVLPSPLSLFPDTQGTATVQLRPPRASSVRAGPKQFSIQVRSTAVPQSWVAKDAVITVAPFVEVALAIVPPTAGGKSSADYRLWVQNNGNAPLSLTLKASDRSELLNLTLDSAALALDPGQSAQVQVAVRPKNTFSEGPPRPHRFTIVVVAGGTARKAAEATFVQEPTPRLSHQVSTVTRVFRGLLRRRP